MSGITAVEREILVNYFRAGNTKGTSEVEISRIIDKCDDSDIASLGKTIERDINQYQISNEDWSNFMDDGKEEAKAKTGYQNNGWDKTTQTARPYLSKGVNMLNENGVTSKAGEALAKGAGSKVVSKLASGEKVSKAASEAAKKASTEATEKALASGATKEAAEKAGQEAGEKAAEGVTSKVSEGAIGAAGALLTGVLELTQGTLAVAKPANKEQVEAADVMKKEMPTLQENSATAAANVVDMTDYSLESADTAATTADETNSEMEEGMGDFELMQRQETYFAKMETAGHEFTEEELQARQENLAAMQQMSNDNNALVEEKSDEITEMFDEVESMDGDYDDAAATMANVDGQTAYAAEFDEKTVECCNNEATSLTAAMGIDGLDAVKAASSAVEYFSTGYGAAIGALYMAGAVMSAAGAVESGIGAGTQKNYATKTQEEVVLRQQTQATNTASVATYEDNISTYEAVRDDMENLEIVQPELEVPEGGNKSTPTAPTKPEDEPKGNDDDDDDKEKPDGPKGKK